MLNRPSGSEASAVGHLHADPLLEGTAVRPTARRAAKASTIAVTSPHAEVSAQAR